jgi:putative ABC transport system permease protein
LYLGFNFWLNGKEFWLNGKLEKPARRGIFVIGFDLEQPVFQQLPELEGDLSPLKEPYHAYRDSLSRPEFGPWRNNDKIEVGGRRIHVVGEYQMGAGFGPDGDIIVSDQTFKRLFSYRPPDAVSLGLVKVVPGADPRQVAKDLRRLLPKDVKVLTRDEIVARERRHWIRNTPIGVIFFFGVIVGFVVGTAIVYMVLSSDIASHKAEYATLKAIGYGPGYLARVVLSKALILSVLGFVPGWAISKLLYVVTSQRAHVPMELRLELAAGVWAMSIVMCAISGLASIRKVTAADPADLF